MSAPFYITTPIYYVNDVPHLGHAYTTIVADALARYHRARGTDTRFLTGTDEHGQKIEEVAQKRGLEPKAHADEVVERFRATWQNLDIAHDDFIRTTEPRHEAVVAEVWRRMAAAGDVYLGEYEGLYCVSCEAFYTEGQLDAGELCPTHKRAVTRVKEPSYFFRLSRYQEPLLAHIDANPDFIQPESRRNEIVAFLRTGLRDISISRTTFRWGIPAPGDPAHVIYVWVDALTNYVSALGGPSAPLYERYWPGACHLLGKDILRFHAVYWPAMLLSAGLPLPRTLFAHGWWTLRGEKISKSLPATRVDPNQLAADLGPDALRYFLLREVPLGVDGDFSYESLIGRVNSDLANDLGNLLHRTLAMTDKYVGGIVPAAAPELDATGAHAELAALAERVRAETERHFDAFAPSRALESIWELVRAANRYVDVAAPWTLAKDPTRRRELEHVIHTFLEAALWAALLAAPVIPRKAGVLLEQLGVPELVGGWPSRWNCELPAGRTTTRGAPLFPRIDEDRQAELLARWLPPESGADAGGARQTDAPATTKPAATAATERPTATKQKPPAPAAPPGMIPYDDFARLDLRVARVLTAERIPGADKLLRLALELGGETRQVVAGLAEAYSPEALIGRSVIFLANLAPRRIRGVESQGMILAAGEEQVLALSALDRDVPPGTKVR